MTAKLFREAIMSVLVDHDAAVFQADTIINHPTFLAAQAVIKAAVADDEALHSGQGWQGYLRTGKDLSAAVNAWVAIANRAKVTA